MTPANRPRRSALYMPGSNARAIDKARSLAADAYILDLEDAVAPDAKAIARANVLAALGSKAAYGAHELVARVNGLDTPWGHQDLAAMARAGADAVLLPKVESDDMVRRAVSVLDAHGGPDDLPIWCMIETPRGVLRALDIADHPRVRGFVIGTSDLAKDMHAEHTTARLPMLAALGIVLLAARAAEIMILDGVHLDLGDSKGLEQACRQGRELGFDGKTLIHPSQIEAANMAFGPDRAAIAQARRIIDAFEAAQAEGKGVVVVDGKLIENLHVVQARRTVEIAESIAAI